MEKNSRVYIAGHHGIAGSSIKRKLEKEGYGTLALFFGSGKTGICIPVIHVSIF